jgi:prepilin-type N-terminal cleavage/methylation domain-containing protein
LVGKSGRYYENRVIKRKTGMANLMNKLKFKGNKAGLSLPEVLIALSIFAVVAVVFTAALGTNFKVLLVADQRTTAESLAKTQLEAINNSPYNATSPLPANPYAKITGIPAPYDLSIAVVLINPETGAVSTTDFGVQKVTVTVTFQGATVLRIESYKR